MAPQLAWIGLGNMGRGMCKNLVEKGNLDKPLIIYNRTENRSIDFSKTLPSGKLTVASTIQDAVSQADIIFTCVGDDAAINDTIDAALKGDTKGKLFVDCSTVHPETTEGLAKKIVHSGAEFCAMPVFGAPAMADSGSLVCVLAGPKDSVEKVKPYTQGVMGRAIVDFGGQPVGKALLLKVIGNTFILNMVETLSEGHVLAEKSGLGTDNLHQFIETMFPGPYAAYSTRMTSGDYYKREEPLFAVDLARKDARHAMALAKASGTHLKDVEFADAHLEQVKKHRGEAGDIASIYGAVRQEAGLKFENDS
ncbi:NAD binding domain of 6-phosphogluconate dehydrogenase-domain-containing protein [Amylocarpus encephaloides]|uniref:NAD binding domain of 6-phosphogluconate dehydrogenase-domain-containing protein n=1 Tax=Amylocarpus encephaloides TaxID=45428 RepID=A0A9P8C2B6_9HELO|nr:NAD binding domain of 6-phosphogluconate dehydrogenase-domain-containing protein [Amylocarpus encephaloides]